MFSSDLNDKNRNPLLLIKDLDSLFGLKTQIGYCQDDISDHFESTKRYFSQIKEFPCHEQLGH